MYYFAYGSNMSARRLKARIPEARIVDTGRVAGHELRFHKTSQLDGSGKCDICPSKEKDRCVYGVIYEISYADRVHLDAIEGSGVGYIRKEVMVQFSSGAKRKATTYFALTVDPSLRPYHWYKEHVLRGAEENHLPVEYIEKISCIASIDDPVPERHEQEMSIYLAKTG